MNNKLKKPELLAPAGSLEKLKIALAYGADAVYAGLPDFSLRTRVNDFNLSELKKGIEYAHKLGKKVYLTFNIYPHEKDLKKVPKAFAAIKKLQPDALIISEPGMVAMARKLVPKIPIHLSTQANSVNSEAVKFWMKQGVERVILARELSLKEIKEMQKKVPKAELEIFVHGSMCMSYSGRCLLSNFFTGRGANQGKCVQPCRWEYDVEIKEVKRPDEGLKVIEDVHGTYFMNSKDMCLMPYLKDVIESGICSLKIEGRLKSIYYVAIATRAYRLAIDAYFDDPKNFDAKPFLKELETTRHRGFTYGFALGPDPKMQDPETACSLEKYQFVGLVKKYKDGFIHLEARNKVSLGEKVELVAPGNTKVHSFILKEIYNLAGERQKVAHGGLQAVVKIPFPKKVAELSMIRKKVGV
ncbi:MAG: U32 family peptidase C-terminal domain-containing protein [Candidatus Gracilibacteria bacterium]|nr:U32 family peptidase C-terminal domain-containing protein [Candidatus Gracilibacteria bacterium]